MMCKRCSYPIWALITVILSTVACTGGESSRFNTLPEQGWAYPDTLIFQQLTDTAGDAIPTIGELALTIRHTNAYLYSNIWLEVSYTDTSASQHTDTLSVELCDVYGRWYGKGAGSLFQIERIVNPHVALRPGSEVKVRHIMRVDTLTGVERIGMAFRSAISTDNR